MLRAQCIEECLDVESRELDAVIRRKLAARHVQIRASNLQNLSIIQDRNANLVRILTLTETDPYRGEGWQNPSAIHKRAAYRIRSASYERPE